MQIVAHSEVPDNASFGRHWNALAQRMRCPQVFYTYEWAMAVSRTCLGGAKPLLICGYENEELAGVAALKLDSKQQASFLSASTADYCDFMAIPGHRREFFQGIFSELRKVGVHDICLANLPADSESVELLKTRAVTSNYRLFARSAYVCRQVLLENNDQRTQTHDSALKRLKRISKSSRTLNEVTISHAVTWEEFEKEFPEFLVNHVQRFLAQGRISNFVRAERRAFLVELGRLLFAQGWMAVSILKSKGRTVAWNYGFKFAGTWFWYQPTFDTELGKSSPGSRLLCDVVRTAATDPDIQIVDLGLGEESYKERFATAGRETLNVFLTCSEARRAREVVRYHSAALVKRSPRLERHLRGSIALASSIRRKVAEIGFVKSVQFYFSSTQRLLGRSQEGVFWEWQGTASVRSNRELLLRPVAPRLLAIAAVAYGSEPEALQYLLRCSTRFHDASADGFVLCDTDGIPVHFCWSTKFEGFWMPELRQRLTEPSPGAVLLFDFWSPRSEQHHSDWAASIATIAECISGKGSQPWVFSSAKNARLLRQAGFVPCFSLRRRGLFASHVSKSELGGEPISTMGLNPAA